MIFFQPVFETVLSVTRRTTNPDGIEGIDISLTRWIRALRRIQNTWLPCIGSIRGSRQRISFPLRLSPFTNMGAFMGIFGTVIEAVCTFA